MIGKVGIPGNVTSVKATHARPKGIPEDSEREEKVEWHFRIHPSSNSVTSSPISTK